MFTLTQFFLPYLHLQKKTKTNKWGNHKILIKYVDPFPETGKLMLTKNNLEFQANKTL